MEQFGKVSEQDRQLVSFSPVIATVFRPKTRYELLEKMKQGNKCEVVKNLSSYNKKIIKFWMKEYGYKNTKSNNGFEIYEPV